MKRVQLEQAGPPHRRQVGGAGGGQDVQGRVEDGAGESQVLASNSQNGPDLTPSLSAGPPIARASHVSTRQCQTNLLDCTCDLGAALALEQDRASPLDHQDNLSQQSLAAEEDQTALLVDRHLDTPSQQSLATEEAQAASLDQLVVPSQRSNLVEVPDFADSPPRLEAVQDAVQVILERDLLTLEEDINSLEKVLSGKTNVDKNPKTEVILNQALPEVNPAPGEIQNDNSSSFRDVSENTRSHTSKRGRVQEEENSESLPATSDGQDPSGNQLKCEICGNISLKTQSQLEIHVAGHLRVDLAKSCSALMRGLQCTLCGLEAKTRNQLVTHIGCKHGRVSRHDDRYCKRLK